MHFRTEDVQCYVISYYKICSTGWLMSPLWRLVAWSKLKQRFYKGVLWYYDIIDAFLLFAACALRRQFNILLLGCNTWCAEHVVAACMPCVRRVREKSWEKKYELVFTSRLCCNRPEMLLLAFENWDYDIPCLRLPLQTSSRSSGRDLPTGQQIVKRWRQRIWHDICVSRCGSRLHVWGCYHNRDEEQYISNFLNFLSLYKCTQRLWWPLKSSNISQLHCSASFLSVSVNQPTKISILGKPGGAQLASIS